MSGVQVVGVQLSPMQMRILKFLAEKQDWFTRAEIASKTGDKKGFSNALGAPRTLLKPTTLEELGLGERRDMTAPFEYRITKLGQSALSDYEARRGEVTFK